MEINITSMTIDELKDEQVIKEIYSNIKNYKRAINMYEERIKEQDNLLVSVIENRLNETIPTPITGEIVYFRDIDLIVIYNDGWEKYGSEDNNKRTI